MRFDPDGTTAYNVPLRSVWLQSQDVIDLRVTGGRRTREEASSQVLAVAHLLSRTHQMLGVSVQDHKSIGLGRWLRRNWERVALDPGAPVPADTVVYDEGAQIAYFSIWPNLRQETDLTHVERRRAQVYFDPDGNLLRVRLPVSVHRQRQPDELAIAAGYLPTR